MRKALGYIPLLQKENEKQKRNLSTIYCGKQVGKSIIVINKKFWNDMADRWSSLGHFPYFIHTHTHSHTLTQTHTHTHTLTHTTHTHTHKHVGRKVRTISSTTPSRTSNILATPSEELILTQVEMNTGCEPLQFFPLYPLWLYSFWCHKDTGKLTYMKAKNCFSPFPKLAQQRCNTLWHCS